MTDQELIRKLLKRNHMLTARVSALAKRVNELEMTRPPAEVLNEGMQCHHQMIEALRDVVNLHSAAIHCLCANVEPEVDSEELFRVANQMNAEMKMENAFQASTAERE